MEFLKKSIHMDQIGCEEQTQITLEDDVNIADAALIVALNVVLIVLTMLGKA